jgi:hypothetical protein
VSSAKFYERFFTLVELFLPPEAKKAAHIVEKPKTELGVPEAKAAPAQLAPTPAPAAEPAPAPAAEPAPAAAPATSEPVAPPAETAPITPTKSTEPTSSTETVTPVADSSTLPPPTEPISAIPVSGQ